MEDTGDHGFCMTLPNNEINDFQAFLVEFLATMLLILVLCSAWDKRNATKHDSLPIKFGLVIIVLALTAVRYLK
jgi:aquaporin related protein